MDLVAGVRKEGSRGGRADFSWSDVQNDQHRENYLGHSVMAPVGRWQKNKDLAWYAKSDTSAEAQTAAEQRAKEIARVKEAEADALAEALGFPVQPKSGPATGANAGEVTRVLKEVGIDEAEHDGVEEDEGGKGIGFGEFEGGPSGLKKDDNDRLGPMGWDDGRGGLDRRVKEEDLRKHDRRRRSQSRDRDRKRRRRRSHSRDRDRDHNRERDRRHRHRRSRSRSPRNERRRERGAHRSHRSRDEQSPRRTNEDRDQRRRQSPSYHDMNESRRHHRERGERRH